MKRAERYARRNVQRNAKEDAVRATKTDAKCPCGCGRPAHISKHGTPGYLKGHRPTVTRTCEVCGESISYKWRSDRASSLIRCRRCAPLKRRVERRLCACGCGQKVKLAAHFYVIGHVPHDASKMRSGSPEWRAKVVPKMQAWRQSQIIPGGAVKVAAVLKSKGITAQDLAFQLGIKKHTARQILNPPAKRANITKAKAERLLRIAAGLPYEPTNRQKVEATREAWAVRRSKERKGEPPRKETPFERRFFGLDAAHLAEPDYLRKQIKNIAEAGKRAKDARGE